MLSKSLNMLSKYNMSFNDWSVRWQQSFTDQSIPVKTKTAIPVQLSHGQPWFHPPVEYTNPRPPGVEALLAILPSFGKHP